MAFRPRRNAVALACAYDDATPEMITFALPEDLAAVADDELVGLLATAQDAFAALDDPEAIDASTVEAMNALADAAEAIRSEQTRRTEQAAEARAAAAELRARMQTPADEPVAQDTEAPAQIEPEAAAEVTDEAIAALIEEETAVVASSDKREPVNIAVPARRRAIEPIVEPAKKSLSLVAAADLPGFPAGSNISVAQAAEGFLARSRSVNFSAMRTAAKAGKRTVQSFGIGSVHKEFPDDLIISPGNEEAVLKRAADSSRLPGGSLVASAGSGESAGWCSPSEVIYELAEAAETTDGLFSLPEVQVDRGGLRHTLGPDFQSIFTEDDLSFNFTEAQVEEGDYDGYGGGSKPVYFVPCPEFVDDRLNVAGVGIRAGLLTERAYPEVIERLVRGALVAHEFKQARRYLDTIIAGSTAVAMGANPYGATSPVLDAIELQVEDYKQRHRVGRGRSLEAIFPQWTRGAIRADLARRSGVMMTNVSDADITAHFATRGVSAQFVYELDDLTGTAANRKAFPESLKFLLYLEGTWIKGTQAVITLEAVFDSALVERNIYTQLFTEEGWLVAKRFHDSRVVTVPICVDGMTRVGFESVETDCDGGSEKTGNGS
jgi:hypothetical protein